MISVKDVDLIFETNDGPVQALRNVSLEVEKGDFVSFIGPSGCGKTTLLRAIAALEIPTKGNLTVNGKSPDSAELIGSMVMFFRPQVYIHGVQLRAI